MDFANFLSLIEISPDELPNYTLVDVGQKHGIEPNQLEAIIAAALYELPPALLRRLLYAFCALDDTALVVQHLTDQNELMIAFIGRAGDKYDSAALNGDNHA